MNRLNGGPGCSSLEGLLQENGPFLLPFNSTDVVKNKYSWTKLANVFWVEQPVSVGLGKGTPDIKNEKELAAEFYSFLVQFYSTFTELKGKKLYLTGESYAGKYIPYIANEIFFNHSPEENKKHGINFQGISINDPSFVNDFFGEEVPSIEFAKKNQKTLLLNDTFIDQLEAGAKANGIYKYVEKNLVYPPKGPITIPKKYNDSFDPFDQIIEAAQLENPNFNIYDIDPKYRYPIYDPLGYPPADVYASATNFINNITGFKKAIHADPSTIWFECVDGVFLNGEDTSPSPADTEIFAKLIEKSPSGRTIVQHGERDFVLIANGSALGIQNTTWNGKQGFQKAPTQHLIYDGKPKGLIQTERGLTFFRPTASGHMIPQDDPQSAFKMLKFFLGQIKEEELYH